MFDQKLLDLLICPTCKKKVVYLVQPERIKCNNCKKTYPICKGIPIMLEEEAEPV